MRIVHVVVDLAKGGLEHLVRNIVLGQIRRGDNVRIVLLSGGGETADRLREAGVEVRITGTRRVRPFSLAKLRWQLLHPRPDIVHLHTLPAGTFGRIALMGSGIPAIYHVHTLLTHAHVLKRRQIMLERLLALPQRPIIAVSEAVRDDLVRKVGISEGRIRVLSGGIPDAPPVPREEARRMLGIPLEEKVVVCLASLYKVKGHANLLEAFARIPGALLLLAGEGPERALIEERIRRPDLAGRVRLPGFVEDAHTLLCAADLAVLASYPREGMPLSVMEAHRAGVPSVVTEIGGLPEVVLEGKTGFIVPPNNPVSLAEAMRQIIDDESLRDQMGRAARERFLERYELKHYLAALNAFYRETNPAIHS